MEPELAFRGSSEKQYFGIDSAIEEENQAVASPKPQNPDHPEPKIFQP